MLTLIQFNLCAQSTMITSKIFIVENVDIINVPDEICCSLHNCKGHKMLIEATIKAECNEQILHALFKAGVFSIIANKYDGKMVFTMPNLTRVTFVKGKELNLNVTWNILVPDEIKFIKSI